MKTIKTIGQLVFVLAMTWSCGETANKDKKMRDNISAKDILGNPDYLAISYGGYRDTSRQIQPTISELKEDMRILNAMGIRVLRTYNVQLAHASNVLKAITELKAEQEEFEMYVMLGAWIDCKNAWTELPPDHDIESEANADEIDRAVNLANQYPDIVKVIAVGNEAMVKWAASYYVQPGVILKWVNHLQNLKKEGKLSKDLWITSSDDFSSWGGGDTEYHVADLDSLIKSVDYISMHTYPMHNTHYNPEFWGVLAEENDLSKEEQIGKAMDRSLEFAVNQYNKVKEYMLSVGVDKPIHIGETGWASFSDGHYGAEGSKATDEFKEGLYYQLMRDWSNKEGVSCFFFEAFNEPWKDAGNPNGSENHFGLLKENGEAKYALWSLVDDGAFEGLTRNGNPIVKTYEGDKEKVLEAAMMPPPKNELEIAQ